MTTLDRPSAAVSAKQAEALGIAPAARVYRWRSHGKLLVRTKIGRTELYSVADLRELNDRADADPRSKGNR